MVLAEVARKVLCLVGERHQLEVELREPTGRESEDIAGEIDMQRVALFDPFHLGDGVAHHEAGGMGMGLALARKLTEEMGGEITVESQPGKGSCFTFTLRNANFSGGEGAKQRGASLE